MPTDVTSLQPTGRVSGDTDLYKGPTAVRWVTLANSVAIKVRYLVSKSPLQGRTSPQSVLPTKHKDHDPLSSS